MARAPANEYRVGTLVIDVLDARTGQLLFRGTATDAFSDRPETSAGELDEALNWRFERFPPGSRQRM
jgi:hypothetical protein